MKKRTIRSLLLAVLLVSVLSAPVFAVRYVDISSIKDVPHFSVKNIEDFEAIIDSYQIPVVYRVENRKDKDRYSGIDIHSGIILLRKLKVVKV